MKPNCEFGVCTADPLIKTESDLELELQDKQDALAVVDDLLTQGVLQNQIGDLERKIDQLQKQQKRCILCKFCPYTGTI
jgi:hypothetical protein